MTIRNVTITKQRPKIKGGVTLWAVRYTIGNAGPAVKYFPGTITGHKEAKAYAAGLKAGR